MNYLVLPLSAVSAGAFQLGLFLNGVIGHALFVGLPISLFARRAAENIAWWVNWRKQAFTLIDP